MITDAPEPRPSTRVRLASAALRLFAEQGFKDTTVGEIEDAAGLQPRRGALYRHFKSKEALLEAAVEAHLARVQQALTEIDALPQDPSQTALSQWGRWFLTEMDAERDVFRILEHDGDRLPQLRETMRARVIDAGHHLIAAMIRRRRPSPDDVDAEALAVLVVGPLANHRRTTWTFGAPPLGVSDDRLLEAWSGTIAAVLGPKHTVHTD